MFELATTYPITTTYSQVALEFSQSHWGAKQVVRTPNIPPEFDPILPDTDIVLSVSEMANSLELIAKPTLAKDVELTFDPDDYPLA